MQLVVRYIEIYDTASFLQNTGLYHIIVLKIIKKLRAKASANPPSLEEITKEVESVRAKRYAKEKK